MKYKSKKGYGVMHIGRKLLSTHRISYEIHIGKIPAGMCVCHKCDNPQCVNPSHLFLGTNLDNTKDKMNKGRHVASPGEKNGAAKLTEKQALEIYKLYSLGHSSCKLAIIYGVSPPMIRNIVKHKNWRCLNLGKTDKLNLCFGESKPCAKLKEKDIPTIFRLFNVDHISQVQIGKMYNVSSHTISSILLRKAWKHVVIPSNCL
jgi:hypothetical protein